MTIFLYSLELLVTVKYGVPISENSIALLPAIFRLFFVLIFILAIMSLSLVWCCNYFCCSSSNEYEIGDYDDEDTEIMRDYDEENPENEVHYYDLVGRSEQRRNDGS